MAKKVILIHPSDEMYGADKVLLEVIESFDPSVNIEVWLPTDITYPKQELTNALYERGIKVRHLRLPILRRSLMTTSGLIKIAGRFLSGSAALLKAHPQKVYLNTAATAPMVLPAKLAGANVIVHLHEYLDGIRAKVTLPLLRRANHVIAVSDAIASVLPKSISQHTSIVHNGFDLPTPTPAPSSGPFRLLLASRWNAWKGQGILLEAWAKLEREDLRLTILGGPPPSGEATDVPRIVSSLPNHESVEIIGETSDVRSVMNKCHAVLVPSTRPDPLPTIAIEALAAGRYLIGSSSGGIPEILAAAPGMLVAPGDVDAWHTALEELDLEGCLKALTASRKRYEDEFTVIAFRRRFSTVLSQVWPELPCVAVQDTSH